MASVAVALSRAGHYVIGSDTQLYPPMSTFLEEHGISYCHGFAEENLRSFSPDAVVVGNAISRGNPELEYALEQHLELLAMPDLVRRHLIANNTSVVVAGTHGKTTTTSLVAWMLEAGGLQPGFLIGGIPENFGLGCRPSAGEGAGFFVTEGDEYDTAFFDKRSKFLLYRPDIAIINNVEFDHADIFNSLEDIKRSFRLFVNLIPRNGLLLVNGDDPVALECAEKAFCPVERFALHANAEWSATNIHSEEEGSSFELLHHGKSVGTFHVPLFGNYNIMNAIAALAAAYRCGVSFEALADGLPHFQRPKRRMELLGEFADGITLIEDFAHHPTAIRVTLEAIAQRYNGRRIVACFEPRSNTTTRNIFQEELASCFAPASVVVLGKVHRPERYGDHALNTALLQEQLQSAGKEVFLAGNDADYPADIIRYLEAHRRHGDVVVLLSNGSFGNLKQMVMERWR